MSQEQSVLLLRKQLKELMKHPVEGFSAGLINENNIYEVCLSLLLFAFHKHHSGKL